jgi:hypothetical protein
VAYPEIPPRILKLDSLALSDHFHLRVEDVCYHLWEYVKGGTYADYATNDLIKNFQIDPIDRGNFRLRHKHRAIAHIARAIETSVPQDFKSHFTWVPVPPSAVRGDAGHDPRLVNVLAQVSPAVPDYRELVLQVSNTNSKEKDISPQDRAANYRIDESLCEPTPSNFVVFDDVIAGGSHFKAMKMVLGNRFPGCGVVGIFVARTIRPDEPTIDIDALLANWRPAK